MDTTENGHSEKNPQKRKNDKGYEIVPKGNAEKIDFDDLPLELREKIMEVLNNDDEIEIYKVDADFQITDWDRIPITFLEVALNTAVENDDFEKAAELKKVIKNRGYSIVFNENYLSLKKNN